MSIFTKLISVRIDRNTADKLDEIARIHPYYTRTDIINAAIKLIVQPEAQKFIGKLMRYRPNIGDKITKFEIEIGRTDDPEP